MWFSDKDATVKAECTPDGYKLYDYVDLAIMAEVQLCSLAQISLLSRLMLLCSALLNFLNGF